MGLEGGVRMHPDGIALCINYHRDGMVGPGKMQQGELPPPLAGTHRPWPHTHPAALASAVEFLPEEN